MYCGIHKDRTSLYHCSASSCGTVFNHVTAGQAYILNTVQSQLITLVEVNCAIIMHWQACMYAGWEGGGGGVACLMGVSASSAGGCSKARL